MFATASYTLLSVIGVSLVSLVGIIFFLANQRFMQTSLLYLVSFSAGAMFGDVFLHMLPELSEGESSFSDAMPIILGGILFSFIVEKFIHWHHCHVLPEGNAEHHHEHHHPVGYLCLIGDGVHNIIDGVLIATSYLISVEIGIATTIAVVFHEIPQEIGDFALLLHSGFSKTSAVLLNLLSAVTAILGAFLVLVTAGSIGGIDQYLLPFAIGNFLYIAGSDLIPELHKQTRAHQGILQFVAMLCGIGVMYLLLFLE